jgi:type I restriction enzyme, S subunit
MSKTAFSFIPASQFCSKVVDGTHESPKAVTVGKPLITSKHIKGRNIDFENAYLISLDDFTSINKRSQVYQWDVIISMIGEYCGYCYVERNENVDYAIKNVGVFRAGSQVNAEWLYYYLNSPIGRSHLRSCRGGSSQPYLSLGALRSLPILVPASEDQKKQIVHVLSTLDAKIELNNRTNEELEGMAKLVYDYWFVQFDFPITAAQAAAMGKPRLEGKPYRASGGKMVYNDALKREIPDGWISGNLESLGKIVGGSTPSTEVSGYFCQRGTPWITPKDMSNSTGNRFIDRGSIDVTSEGIIAASLKTLPAGTVLMSSRAPIGYLAVARNAVTTNQGLKSIVPGNGFSTDYIYFTLNHFMGLIKANASGSTFKEISGGTLKAVQIHLPPGDLVTKFTEYASCLSSQQSLLEQQNQELTELRDWLLPMLMNGQVTVT